MQFSQRGKFYNDQAYCLPKGQRFSASWSPNSGPSPKTPRTYRHYCRKGMGNALNRTTSYPEPRQPFGRPSNKILSELQQNRSHPVSVSVGGCTPRRQEMGRMQRNGADVEKWVGVGFRITWGYSQRTTQFCILPLYCIPDLKEFFFNWWRASLLTGFTPPWLRPWNPYAFGLRTLDSLVNVNDIFRKNLFQIFSQVPSSLLNTKSAISQKLRIAQNETHQYTYPIQNIAHLFRCPKIAQIVNKIINNSKNTIHNFFHQFQNIAQQFGPENRNGSF